MKEPFVQRLDDFSVRHSWFVILIAVERVNLFDLEALQAFESAIRTIEANETIIGSINPFNFLTFKVDEKKLSPVTAAPEGRAPLLFSTRPKRPCSGKYPSSSSSASW